MASHQRQFAQELDVSEGRIPSTRPREEWADDDLGPAWYVLALLRRWPLILLATLVAGVAGFWNASIQPLRYEGVTTLMVVPPSQGGGAQVNPATFRAIVENLTLASQVIDELKLQGTFTPHSFLEQALTVEELRGTNIVRVKVTLDDPQLAADASRRLAGKAIVLAQEIAQQNGASVQEQLKRFLDDAAQRMQKAERELLEFKQRAQIDLIKEDTDAQLKERADLLRLVILIESERARLSAAENEIKRQQPVLQAARSPAAEEAMRRVQASLNPKPESSPRDLDKERTSRPIDPTKGDVDTDQLDLTSPLVNPVYQTLDFQIATSRTRIAALEKQRDEVINVKKLGGTALAQLGELYRREIDQGRLQADYDLSMKVHGDLALRYEQSRAQPVGNTSQLQVVDHALPPDNPVARKRVQKALLGAGVGFVAAALFTLAWDGRKRWVTTASA